MDQSLQFPFLCRYYSLIFCTPTCWVIVPLPMYCMNSCQKIRDYLSILKNIPYTLAISSFRLWLLNCFNLLFVHSWRQGSIFILLQTQIQFWQHYLLNKLSFTCCLFLSGLSKFRWLYLLQFITLSFILLSWSNYVF